MKINVFTEVWIQRHLQMSCTYILKESIGTKKAQNVYSLCELCLDYYLLIYF